MSIALRKAIKLREWTRRAIESDDASGDRCMTETFRLNRLADDALNKLNGVEMAAYSEWARGDYPTVIAAFKAAMEEARKKVNRWATTSF